MKIGDLNWGLIILTSLGVAVGINVLILLFILLLFHFEIFKAQQVLDIENYFFLFLLFSPLTASLVSYGIVTFFSTQKKLLNTVFSTILTFWLTCAILVTVLVFVGDPIYSNFDRRANPCYYEKVCGE
jgi:putative effector of murein hydrolase LrgA (UPF0299 family)